MEKLKVIKIDSDFIEFENGIKLSSDHYQECCEHHYLSFEDLTLSDFDNLEFNLSDESFFKRIEDYGIELIPINGWSVKIPGYGYNNGYYSSDLSLVLSDNNKFHKTFDISDCQVISG